MFELGIAVIQFCLGLAFLIIAADKFIFSCINISEKFNLPKALVGLTLVAFGTSLPELVLTITATYKGEADIAIGNVVGSNVSNIGLVFTTSLLISKSMLGEIKSKSQPIILLIVTAICSYILYSTTTITKYHGILLLLLSLGCVLYFWKFSILDENDPLPSENEVNIKKNCLWLIATTAIIPISAHFLLEGGVQIAKYFGFSTLIIGLLLMAIGTSLPELATSISAAMRGERDLVIGNIIGSNIFNLTLVLGSGALVSELPIPDKIANFDSINMLVITLIFVCALLLGKRSLRIPTLALLSGAYIYFIIHAIY
ncbi:MAG: calcium/sodium antiporter [Francisellaceae bacterium]|jgi:cation:H+ antiporter|nr:calcium/sodium antiporter [Francisellaceae bacterium]MBT6208258.1 calcium/sodium antiporter [Francisellaceae bacterium]MBT6539023.1 calcium/sodium antiporter [Francisellaceae bacterium]